MNRYSKYIVFALVILGGCIGMTFLTPRFNISQDTGILLGLALGFIVAMLIPNLWKSFFESVKIEYQEAVDDKRHLNFKEYITHPTLLPFLVGGLWFLCYVAFLTVFQIKPAEEISLLIGFLPAIFSFGLCGFRMITRREYVKGDMFGYLVVRSKWAIVWGAFTILLGWGGAVILVLATILDW